MLSKGRDGRFTFLLRGGKLRTPESRKPQRQHKRTQDLMPRLEPLVLSHVSNINNNALLLNHDMKKYGIRESLLPHSLLDYK